MYKDENHMTNILICDASKPSIVMTSEVFKDKLPGALVMVANCGKDALELLKEFKADMCVIDFDLPDVDGPTLIEMIRRTFDGPILLTAFADDIVKEAVENHLFTYNDAGSIITKPVTFQSLSEKIDLFLVEKHRLDKRFSSDFCAQIIAKAAGRGKRAPKASGRIVNISMGGVCVELDEESMKIKRSQEVTMTISTPASKKAKKAAAAKGDSQYETKIKGTVAWVQDREKLGVCFTKQSDMQRKELMAFLRMADQNDQLIPIG